jgi:hypothetical protein
VVWLEADMPTVTVDNPLTLPRLAKLSSVVRVPRPVQLIVTAHEQMERDRHEQMEGPASRFAGRSPATLPSRP